MLISIGNNLISIKPGQIILSEEQLISPYLILLNPPSIKPSIKKEIKNNGLR